VAATVEGAFKLIDGASRPLNKIRDAALEADAAVDQLGETIDRLGSTKATTQVDNLTRKVSESGRESEKASVKYRMSMDQLERSVSSATRGARTDLERLDLAAKHVKSLIEMKVEVRGGLEAEAILREIERRQNALQREAVKTRVGSALGLGSTAGKGTATPGFFSRLGSAAKSAWSAITPFGTMPTMFAAAAPVIIDLAGAVVALGSSLGEAAIGLGALTVGAGAAAGVGLAGIASIAIPAVTQIKNLTTAQTNYTKAIQTYGRSSSQAQTAAKQLQAAQAAAPQGAAGAAKQIADIKSRWTNLTQTGQKQFFGLIQDAGKHIDNLLPTFAKSANKSMGAARRAVGNFMDRLDSPAFRKVIDRMTTTFQRISGPISRSFSNIGQVFGRIAVAVAPDVEHMAHQFEGITKDWMKSTNNAHRLRDQVHGLVQQTQTWLKFIGSVAGTIKTVAEDAAGPGKRGVQGMTDQFNQWNEWLQKHPRQVKQFFQNAIDGAGRLAHILGPLFQQVFTVSEAMRPISSGIERLVEALNSVKIGNVSGLTALLGGILGVRAFGKIKGGVQTLLGGTRGSTPANPLFVDVVNQSPTGGGTTRGGTATGLSTIGEDLSVAKGAGVPGGGPGALGARFSNFASKNPIAAAGGIALGIQGFSAMGAPGTQNTVGNKLNAFAHGADPTRVLHLVGLPAVSDLLPEVKKNPTGNVVSIMKNALGIPDIKGPLNLPKHTSLGSQTAPTSASMTKDLGQAALDDVKHLLDRTEVTGKGIGGVINGLKQKYGSLVAAGHDMSDQQQKVFISLAAEAKKNGDLTGAQFRQLTSTIGNNTDRWNSMIKKAADATGESQKQIRQSIGNTTVTVSSAYDNMVKVTGGGLNWLTSNTSKAAQALGVKQQINFHTTPIQGSTGSAHVQGTVGNEHLAGQRRGGLAGVVPGVTSGDNHTLSLNGVPISKVESGEGIFVGNRNMMAVAAKRNAEVPRYKQGGLVYPIRGLTQGRTDMGVDFSGAGTIAAMGDATIVGTGAPGWPGGGGVLYKLDAGAPQGVGPLSSPYIYNYEAVNARVRPGQHVSAGQVIGSVNSSYPGLEMGFGTASGAAEAASHYSEGDVTAEGQAFAKLLSMLGHGKFVGGGAVQKIKRLLLKGPQGALKLRSAGQASLDKVWKAGNAYLKKKSGHTVGGVGTFPATKGGWHRVGATAEGLDGQQGAYGTVGGMGFAELLLAGANAGMHPNLEDVLGTRIPPMGKVGFKMPGSDRMATAVKNDIGSGQPGDGHYLVDIQTGLANAIGWHPNQDVLVKALARGGVARSPRFAGWHGSGGNFLTNGPTLFGAGENGTESVSITPGLKGGGQHSIKIDQIVVQNHRPGDIQDQIEKELVAAFGNLSYRLEHASPNGEEAML
jgi:superoxide dismutase